MVKAPSKGTAPLYDVKNNSAQQLWTSDSLLNRKI